MNVAQREAKKMFRMFTRRIRPIMRSLAQERFDTAKKNLLEDIKNHPVSKDLESHQPSPYLGDKGTLFGFLGFEYGEAPVIDLWMFLDQNIRFYEKKSFFGLQKFTVTLPNKKSLSSVINPKWTSIPWPIMIEEGISNLPYFLSKLGKGRSIEGIQTKNTIKQVTFQTTEYLTPLFAKFKKDLLLR